MIQLMVLYGNMIDSEIVVMIERNNRRNDIPPKSSVLKITEDSDRIHTNEFPQLNMPDHNWMQRYPVLNRIRWWRSKFYVD